MNEDIEEIRRKKMLELQKKLLEAQREEELRREYEARKEAILRTILTSEARSRLANIKMVKPGLVSIIEKQLIQLAQAGRITSPITDEQLKMMLKKLVSKKRETKIIFR